MQHHKDETRLPKSVLLRERFRAFKRVGFQTRRHQLNHYCSSLSDIRLPTCSGRNLRPMRSSCCCLINSRCSNLCLVCLTFGSLTPTFSMVGSAGKLLNGSWNCRLTFAACGKGLAPKTSSELAVAYCRTAGGAGYGSKFLTSLLRWSILF